MKFPVTFQNIINRRGPGVEESFKHVDGSHDRMAFLECEGLHPFNQFREWDDVDTSILRFSGSPSARPGTSTGHPWKAN
jgi:hypothetical protein